MTPAQASGHPSFVTSPGPGGPTDEGQRKAACAFSQTLPAAYSECVDCKGTIPMSNGLLSEQISFGGRTASGFALAAAGDPDVWTKLNAAQQKWVIDTLTTLNNLIYQATGTKCSTWGPSITAAGGCFQSWFNKNSKLTRPDGSPLVLRTDGVFDQDTLDALTTTAAMDPAHFPQSFPPGTVTSAAPTGGLSKGAVYGIAAGGAAVVGGIIYAVTRKPKRRRRR